MCAECAVCFMTLRDVLTPSLAVGHGTMNVFAALPALDLPKVRRNELIEIIPLSTGCLGSCTYCKTKHARGKLGSYTLEAIVDRAKKAIAEGVSEIWLSSEDTGTYPSVSLAFGVVLGAFVCVICVRVCISVCGVLKTLPHLHSTHTHTPPPGSLLLCPRSVWNRSWHKHRGVALGLAGSAPRRAP